MIKTRLKNKKYNITVVGSGYVGMSLAVLLAQQHKVIVLDIDHERVKKINAGMTTIADDKIDAYLSEKDLSLSATQDPKLAYKDASFVIVATPTNYDPESNRFDTASVDMVVKQALEANSNCLVVIKSTIPVGHTKFLQDKYSSDRVIFSPEFLREGMALYDNLYPSRIVVGSHCEASRVFASLLSGASEKKNIKILFVHSTEAEAIKLFANTYLAMRVSFFNELDSYALSNELNSKSIIQGMCLDPRIGEGYNNPSFGYGGYCLPKDTKQLLANYGQVPQTLIAAIVSSNSTRKDFIAEEILKRKPATVGFYRLVMKQGSDNFRSSAIQGIMSRIKSKGVKLALYEPELDMSNFLGAKIFTDLEKFKNLSDVIVVNRNAECLSDVYEKCFSRDIFGDN